LPVICFVFMFSRWEWRGARALFLPVLKVQEPAVEVGAAAQRDIPKPRNPTGEGMDDGKESKLAIKGEGSGWTGGKRAATFFDDCRAGLFPVRGHGYGRVLGLCGWPHVPRSPRAAEPGGLGRSIGPMRGAGAEEHARGCVRHGRGKRPCPGWVGWVGCLPSIMGFSLW
jgi:hypothetical protein